MEQARAWLYIRKGALSASRESASSQRKLIPFSGETRRMLKRTEEIPTASPIVVRIPSSRSERIADTTSVARAVASSSRSSMNTTLPRRVLILPSGSFVNA